MKLEPKELETFKKIRETIEKSERPLYFFHDDPDGLCSFLCFRKYFNVGYGVTVKSKPVVNDRFYNKIEEYSPDCVITLDLAIVEQDFIDFCKARNIKIIIIDHHALRDITGFDIYYNPKFFRKTDNTANAALSYYILEENEDLLWIATVGTVADWQKPTFYKKIKEMAPDLLIPYDVSNKCHPHIETNYSKLSPEYLLYNTNIGYLTRLFSFALKGRTSNFKKSIAALIRIKSYKELLEKSTGSAKFIAKSYDNYFDSYCSILTKALNSAKDQNSKVIIFTYENKDSFTGELSNHLYYFFKDKFIMVGRFKDDEYRMSARFRGNALKILTAALKGLNGSGGGHKHSCGFSIHKNDFDEFIKRIESMI